jgi:hypothetical protein
MGSPNVLVPIALVLFFPAVYLVRRTLGPTRGVLASLLGGWLFLPSFSASVLDVPLLGSKVAFVPTAVLIVSVVSDWRRWSRLRPHGVDLAAAVISLGPFATALSNGLGLYEGASALLEAFCSWGTPYLLGRVYLGKPRASRRYALWLVAAALVYVPLCLWEIRMSPQLHRVVYGYRAAGSFVQAVRYGGYRPSVFMAHGLAVGTFMATGTLIAYWLWRSRAAVRVAWLPLGWSTVLLAATTVLVKSTAAIALLAVGIAVLEGMRLVGRRLPILLLTLLPAAYCAARISGWTASELVEATRRFDRDRAQSVQYRIVNEGILLEKAEQRPWLGWGRFGRSRVYDEDMRDVSVTDGLWIIALGVSGRLGLISVGSMLLLPVLLLLRRFPARHWDRSALGPIAALAVATVLWVLDCLLNAMNGPLFPAMAGSMVTFLQYTRERAGSGTIPAGRSARWRMLRPTGPVPASREEAPRRP